jgi:hypothetical protein
MGAPASPTLDLGPDWVAGEMPPGYHNRLVEIQQMLAELQGMGRFGRLLYENGAALGESVCDLFSHLRFETELRPGTDCAGVVVKLDTWSRLLLHVSPEQHAIPKKSPEIGHVFQVLHEFADDHDRVVFVTNTESATRPTERAAALAPDALAFLARMGVVHVTAPTLFALWKLSLQDQERAREQVKRLHAHDGGTFQIAASALML